MLYFFSDICRLLVVLIIQRRFYISNEAYIMSRVYVQGWRHLVTDPLPQIYYSGKEAYIN